MDDLGLGVEDIFIELTALKTLLVKSY